MYNFAVKLPKTHKYWFIKYKIKVIGVISFTPITLFWYEKKSK